MDYSFVECDGQLSQASRLQPCLQMQHRIIRQFGLEISTFEKGRQFASITGQTCMTSWCKRSLTIAVVGRMFVLLASLSSRHILDPCGRLNINLPFFRKRLILHLVRCKRQTTNEYCYSHYLLVILKGVDRTHYSSYRELLLDMVS
jgi:hypothetical protein